MKPVNKTTNSNPSSTLRSLALGVVLRILIVALIIGITIIILSYKNAITHYPISGYSGIFLISVLSNSTIILPVSSSPVVFIAGSVLNPIIVGVIAGSGAALGEMSGYLAGFAGHEIMKNRKIYKWIEIWLIKWEGKFIFLLALIPNPLFDLVGIIAGTFKVPWWKFWIATATGKSIQFILLATLGTHLLA